MAGSRGSRSWMEKILIPLIVTVIGGVVVLVVQYRSGYFETPGEKVEAATAVAQAPAPAFTVTAQAVPARSSETPKPVSTPVQVSGGNVRRDEFDGAALGPDWQVKGELAPRLEGGQLIVDFAPQLGYGEGGVGLHLGDRPLAYLEGGLVYRGGRHSSFVSLQVQLGRINGVEHYAVYGLRDDNHLFVAVVPDGGSPDPVEDLGEALPAGQVNVLRVEFDAGEARFSANGRVVKRVPAAGGGWWSNLYTTVYAGGAADVAVEYVEWAVKP